MKVSVVDLSASQKKMQVEIPSRKVQRELDKRYRDLAKQVRLKGFRPGKIPRKILESYYGKSVQSEVSNQFIQETFPEALNETGLKLLAEADVSEMRYEDNGSFVYEATLEVCPPFQVEGYKGLNVHRPSVQVNEEQIEADLERIRNQHARVENLESDRPVEEGDTVVIDFTPWVDETVYEKGKTTDYLLEVGKQVLHPDFDKHLIAKQRGEAFSFELDYPEDAPSKEIAGKRVRFDVTLKEIKEKILPDLNDDFVKKLGSYETVEALREEIRSQMEKRENETADTKVREQIREQLLERVHLDISPKVVEREVDFLIEQLVHQFQSQGMKIEASHFNTPEIRAEYRIQGEKNVRWRLILRQIAAQENIELTEEDREQIYEEVARLFKIDIATVKSDYANTSVLEQMQESKLQEKVNKLLVEEAVYVEPSEDNVSQDVEESV